MLYQAWREVAREQGDELALWDVGSGRRWSFSQLARLVEGLSAPSEPLVYPQGQSAEFIFAVLGAWRHSAVVCPLEPGQRSLPVPPPPAPCGHLKISSGTSGQQRVVAFRPEQLAADAGQIVATLGLRRDWPNLGVISLAHSYGFSNLVLALLLKGIPLVLAPSPLPEVMRQAASGCAHLTLAGVPALWRAWHETRAIPPNVRLALSAGALLPAALERAVFDATGLKIHNFYGTSECGGIAYDPSDGPRTDEACVGVPVKNVELTVNDEACLEVRSAAVGETYWPSPEDTLGQGRFRTSDLAELKDGLVYLRGRVTDQINVAGRKVSPDLIERTLLDHEAVAECLVFGVPSRDADRTEVIVACITVKRPANAGMLKDFLLTRLPAWQVPREWWFVESLTRNARGKVSRAEYKTRFLER